MLRCMRYAPILLRSFVSAVRSYSLSPVLRGEGWGEGPFSRAAQLDQPPLTPTLSPEYGGEGACPCHFSLQRISTIHRQLLPRDKIRLNGCQESHGGANIIRDAHPFHRDRRGVAVL